MIPWAELPTKSVLGLIPAFYAEGPRYNLWSVITRTLDPQSLADFSDAFERFMKGYPLTNGSALIIETFPIQGVAALPDNCSAFPHRNHFHNQIELVHRKVYEWLDDRRCARLCPWMARSGRWTRRFQLWRASRLPGLRSRWRTSPCRPFADIKSGATNFWPIWRRAMIPAVSSTGTTRCDKRTRKVVIEEIFRQHGQ